MASPSRICICLITKSIKEGSVRALPMLPHRSPWHHTPGPLKLAQPLFPAATRLVLSHPSALQEMTYPLFGPVPAHLNFPNPGWIRILPADFLRPEENLTYHDSQVVPTQDPRSNNSTARACSL